jgi:hypothetical protein
MKNTFDSKIGAAEESKFAIVGDMISCRFIKTWVQDQLVIALTGLITTKIIVQKIADGQLQKNKQTIVAETKTNRQSIDDATEAEWDAAARKNL